MAFPQIYDGDLKVIKLDPVYTTGEARNAVRKCFADNVDMIIYFSSCWIESSVVIAAVQEVKIPYVVWGFSDYPTQSLLGAVEVVTSLRNIGEKFKIIYGKPEDDRTKEEILTRAKAAGLYQLLRMSKIGFIGGIAFSMYDAIHDLAVLRKKLGVDVVHIDQYRVMKEIETVSEKEVDEEIAKTRKKVGDIVAGDEHLRKSVKVYIGLKRVIQKFGLIGAVVKCHPDLSQTYGACACLAASNLIDEGFPCACEGNLYTAVTAYILNELTGNPPFCHEISSVDDKDDTMMLWHCGAGATKLAENPKSVRIQQQYGGTVDPADREGSTGGVTMDFWIRPGKATIAQLGGIGDDFRMHLGSGEILKGREMDLGSGKIWARALMKIDSPEQFLKDALGHQFVTVHGNVENILRELCEIADIQAL